MKTTFTLLLIALLAGATSAQAQNAVKSLAADRSKSILVYSEEEEALIYKTDVSAGAKEILIETLPEYGKAAIPVMVNQELQGSFTFKKHPALLLPEFYDVIIEDTMTGEQFDLKKADSYSFNVSKLIPERFLLQMTKVKTNLTAMR